MFRRILLIGMLLVAWLGDWAAVGGETSAAGQRLVPALVSAAFSVGTAFRHAEKAAEACREVAR